MRLKGTKWRYDFRHSKSGFVIFGGTKPQHCESLKNREWLLGDIKIIPTSFYEISKMSYVCSLFCKSVCIRVVHIF